MLDILTLECPFPFTFPSGARSRSTEAKPQAKFSLNKSPSKKSSFHRFQAQEGSNGRRELFLLEKLGDCLLSLERFDDANGFYQQLLTLAQQIRAVAQIKRAYTKLAMWVVVQWPAFHQEFHSVQTSGRVREMGPMRGTGQACAHLVTVLS